MDMTKEAIEKIVTLATPEIYDINGEAYTSTNLSRVAPHIDRPSKIVFSSLDSIVQAVKAELGREEIEKPLFVNVESFEDVRVFTTFRKDNMQRDELYVAQANLPRGFETWSYHDDAIIALKSRFIPNEDVDYVLDLLSRISSEGSVSSEDNGVSQKVSATQGVALKATFNVKPRVKLAPFRTFLEVAQPESEFILRLKAGNKESGEPPKIGIIEADGGAWKLEARSNVAEYFRERLVEFIAKELVIVAE